MNPLVVGLAFLWGWAEATWFFVIPDVWLTFAVFWGRRTSAAAVVAALGGALAGAVHFYLLDDFSRQLLSQWWRVCPGYGPGMAEVIAQHLAAGPAGLCHGPWLGIPYRFYLLQAEAQGMSLVSVLAWTVWARLPRLILAPLIVGPVYAVIRSQAVSLGMGQGWKRLLAILFAALWMVIYADYWFVYVPRTYA